VMFKFSGRIASQSYRVLFA